MPGSCARAGAAAAARTSAERRRRSAVMTCSLVDPEATEVGGGFVDEIEMLALALALEDSARRALEVEEDLAMIGPAEEALCPRHRDLARPARYRLDAVHHRRRVGNRRPGRELVCRLAARRLHHQFAPVIVLGVGEEDCDRYIRPQVV